MRLHKNSRDGEIVVYSNGSIDFTDLVSHADDPSDWDYWILNNDEVQNIPSICILFQNDALDKITPGTQIQVVGPGIGETSENVYGIGGHSTLIPAGTPEPSDFSLKRNYEYYEPEVITSAGGTLTFNQQNLLGQNGTWDAAKDHYVRTDMAEVLYLENGNCFGLGVTYRASRTGADGLQVGRHITIFHQFDGIYDEWQTPSHNAWNARTGGILAGSTVFTDLPWNAVAFSENTAFKANFTISETITLPNTAFETKSYFCLAEITLEDVKYQGVLGVTVNLEGIATSASFWGIGDEFWTSQGSTDYSIDAEDTVDPATPTGWTKSNWLPTISPIPNATDNPLLHSMGGEVPLPGGVRSGWKSYRLWKNEYDTIIAELYNPKSTFWSRFSDNLGLSTGQDAVTSGFGKPYEAIMSVYCLPLHDTLIPTAHSSKNIQIGGVTTSVSEDGHICDDRLAAITFQSEVIKPKARYLNFTDTRVELYLPFLGCIPLDTQDVFDNFPAPAYITAEYRIDLLTGNCVIHVYQSSNIGYKLLYTGTANISCPVPIVGQSNFFERLCSGVQSGLKSVVSIGAGNVIGGVGGAIEGLQSISQQKGYSTLGGAPEMISGEYQPYLKIYRPKTPQDSFTGVSGYPSAAVGTVGQYENEIAKGFNSYRAVDVSGISGATDGEKAEIESLLKGGIWL